MLPLINNYEDLEAYNNSIATKSTSSLSIEHISYKRDRITYKDENGRQHGSIINMFLYEWLMNKSHLIGKVHRLRDYDFTKLLCLTHPKMFMEQIQDYANNLLLLGEDKFTLWDFELGVKEKGCCTILNYKNNEIDEVFIPYFITKIEPSAFQWKKNIIKVTFQEGSRLKCIASDAFERCMNLYSINLPDTLEDIRYGAFSGTDLRTLILPTNLKKIGECAFNACTKLEKVICNSDLRGIGTGAFFGCTNLKEINLPNSLKRIEPEAFKYCGSLEEISIPDSVTKLGSESFVGCEELKRITIGRGIKKIEGFTFQNCTKLKDINILGDVVKIGPCAFEETGIEELILPKSVEPSIKKMYSSIHPTQKENLTNKDNVSLLKSVIAQYCHHLKKVEFR